MRNGALRDFAHAVRPCQAPLHTLRHRVCDAITDPESVPKRTRVVEFYTASPSGPTVICADEPGLVIPRTLKAAVNLLVGRDWLTGPLGRKEHASQRSTTGLNELGRQYR